LEIPCTNAAGCITDFSLIPRKATRNLRPIGGRQQFSFFWFYASVIELLAPVLPC